MADSASVDCSIPISSSLNTLRSTRTTFSSEQKTSACKLINLQPWEAFVSAPDAGGLFIVLVVQQVGHAAELFRGSLQSFNLLAKLRLLGLFPAQYFVDIPHPFCLLIAL